MDVVFNQEFNSFLCQAKILRFMHPFYHEGVRVNRKF